MAIARNKAKVATNKAIEEFGIAAETRSSVPIPDDASAEHTGPKTALIRWKGGESLRDRIKEYSRRERFSEQEIIHRALAIGIEQIEREGMN